MPTYLGLDSSTQSLTATLIRVDGETREIVGEHSLVFDGSLPHFGTYRGVIRDDDPAMVLAPPLMWVEALDQLMSDICRSWRRELADLAALSGSAQQHGSVYLNSLGLAQLTTLDPLKPAGDQLRPGLSRVLSPVWMDSSTAEECREIEQTVGGGDVMARRTGARATERFTGPQIRAFFKRDPRAYDSTARIHLVSSFLASVLAGADAPIDYGDGSGMNLMDVAARAFWPAAMDATAPRLAEKLLPIAASWTSVGTLSRYWRERYHLPPARVIAWSGDNPCSLIGTGLVAEGALAISLGTSDTVCGVMCEFRSHADGIGYVSASPTGDYMGTTTFMNGSLARERIRDNYGLDWARVSAALASSPPGNRGGLMLPWFDPEITPRVSKTGLHRRNLDPADQVANVRAIVEAQMMAMANHTQWMSADASLVYATGGASGNRAVLQVMADVFGAEVVRPRSGNGAALGAALRAFHGERLAAGHAIEWKDVIRGFTDTDQNARVQPNAEATRMYAQLRKQYAEFENEVLRNLSQ